MYEESLRAPLIVRWPGVVEPGTVNTDLVMNLDFAPTLLDLGSVPAAAGMQGRSLVPLLRGRTPADWRDAIYYQYFAYPDWHMVHRQYGVRTHRHKLIHYYELGEWELFDLALDPDELRSVYDDPRYARIRDQLSPSAHTEPAASANTAFFAVFEAGGNALNPAEWLTRR
jgi:arylsulfatase A-like enzyme